MNEETFWHCVGVKCEREMTRVRKRESDGGKERAKRAKEWRGSDAKCVCVCVCVKEMRKTGGKKREKEKDGYGGNDGRWEKRASVDIRYLIDSSRELLGRARTEL